MQLLLYNCCLNEELDEDLTEQECTCYLNMSLLPPSCK